MKENLKKLGLSENAVNVYLSLLKIGETAVGAIIFELKLHRQSVYNALDELTGRNLVRKSIKNKVSHYKATNPDVLVASAEQQAIIAKRVAKEVKEAMKKSRHEHEINVYDGEVQIRNYIISKYREFSNNDIVYITNGYSDKFYNILGKKFMEEECAKLRTKRRIHSRHLANIQFRDEFIKSTKTKNAALKQTRFLPYNLTHLATTVIWPDAVNIQSFVDHPFIIEIKNEKLRISYLEQFKVMWKLATKS